MLSLSHHGVHWAPPPNLHDCWPGESQTLCSPSFFLFCWKLGICHRWIYKLFQGRLLVLYHLIPHCQGHWRFHISWSRPHHHFHRGRSCNGTLCFESCLEQNSMLLLPCLPRLLRGREDRCGPLQHDSQEREEEPGPPPLSRWVMNWHPEKTEAEREKEGEFPIALVGHHRRMVCGSMEHLLGSFPGKITLLGK